VEEQVRGQVQEQVREQVQEQVRGHVDVKEQVKGQLLLLLANPNPNLNRPVRPTSTRPTTARAAPRHSRRGACGAVSPCVTPWTPRARQSSRSSR